MRCMRTVITLAPVDFEELKDGCNRDCFLFRVCLVYFPYMVGLEVRDYLSIAEGVVGGILGHYLSVPTARKMG